MKLLALWPTLWGPLRRAVRVSAGLSALAIRGWPLDLFLAAHAVVTALGFAALLSKQPTGTVVEQGRSKPRRFLVWLPG